MSWYLRSISDHDTHCGELATDGTVTATCGLTFRPKTLPRGRLSLLGHPYDRAQICPACDPHRNGGAE